MSSLRANIPILSRQQTWSRNELYKNWGKYRVFMFKEGKPSILVPNSTVCHNTVLLVFYYLSFTVFLIGSLILDLNSNKTSALNAASRVILLISNIVSFIWLIYTDPGIVSISDPVINTAELARYQNYCVQCKCMQNDRIRHCPYCEVCIEDSFAHLAISKLCVTRKNILPFCVVCLSCVLQCCLML